MSTDINEMEAWRLKQIIASAIALADSGRYHDFADIDYALRFEHGWIQARAHVDEPGIRTMLNRRCADARDTALDAAIAAATQPPTMDAETKAQRRFLSLLTLRHVLGIRPRAEEKTALNAPAGTLPS